jgi:hypothetical protein
MRRALLVLLAVVAACAAYLVAHLALIEVGREVIVLRTENSDGTWLTRRLWIVDHEGAPWLHGGNSDWMGNLKARPIVEVERAGETHRYRAHPLAGPHPEIDTALRAKYGVADRWVRFVGGDRASTMAVRLERVDGP